MIYETHDGFWDDRIDLYLGDPERTGGYPNSGQTMQGIKIYVYCI